MLLMMTMAWMLVYRIILMMMMILTDNFEGPEKVLVLEGENHVASQNVQRACLVFPRHLILILTLGIMTAMLMIMALVMVMMMVLMFLCPL